MQFNDRRSGGTAPGALAHKPPVLRRWTISLFAVLGILGITYGTLAPFQIDHDRPFTWQLQSDGLVPGDAIANILIYVPVGLFFRLLVRRRGSWWPTECLLSLVLAAGLSYFTEACQTVLASRVPSWWDFCCNVIGATLGLICAPLVQRVLRDRHAWLYGELRSRPFGAAAAGTIILASAAALMPFDIQPTRSHVAAALWHVRNATLALPWTSAVDPAIPLAPVQIFDKMTAAACYGLVAFLMAIGRRELGCGRAAAVWFALTRTIALTSAIELLQVFTIAHTADPRDLVMGWLFAAMGAGAAWSAMSRSRDGLPRPAVVLRGLVMVLAMAIAGRATLAAAFVHHDAAAACMASWLPMASAFHRPWASLLGDYLTTFLQYALLAGLLVLWSRAGRHRPSGWVVGASVAVACAGAQAFGVAAGRPVDTAAFLLAVLAAWLAVRLDRALFGRVQARECGTCLR